jgi:type I restriction enzyme S subunit
MSDSLPRGWVKTSLGDVCSEKVVQAPPKQEPVLYVDISAIDRSTKRICETNLVTGADAPSRARQWLRTNDVLVSMTRPNLNAVAKVGAELDGAVASTGFDVLRSLGVVPEWIFFRVRTNEFVADVCEDLQGVVYPAIRPNDVRRHRLPVPPLPEQHRIVSAIESYFTRLDDAVATLERVQRNLKRYRASVLKAAVEGRLVPTEAELARAEGRDYEPASVLLERILAERRRHWEEAELAKLKAKGKAPKDDKWKAKYVEPVAPDAGELPELPEGWCWATLDSLAAVKGGITKGQKPKPGERYREVAYLRVANVQRGYLDLSQIKTISALDTTIEDLRLEYGDVLFNEGGDRDKLGRGWVWRAEILECIHQNHVFRARVYTDDLQPELLSWYGNTAGQRYFFDEGKQTTNLASINQTKLRALPVPIPPRAEQLRIRAVVEQQLSVADEALRSMSIDVARLARLRQSILKWAFEGRLVDQDPTDEPASVLLERIRAERAAAATQQPKRAARRNARSPNA